MSRATSSRRRLAAPVALLFAAATLGAASAATAAPATAVVRALPAPRALNYAACPGQRLRQLNPGFIASQLGLPPPTDLSRLLSGGGRPTAPSTASAVGSGRVSSSRYTCVNGRQTADPLSPPCVASFAGDNGGATYQGVSGGEIRLLVVNAIPEDLRVSKKARWGTYYDLGKPPTDTELNEMPSLNRLRLYKDYFNRHYATYGRHVRFIVYSRNQLGSDPAAACRNTALENLAFVQPFAAFLAFSATDPSCYAAVLASRGVPLFEPFAELERSQYAKHPGLLWGLRPDRTNANAMFSTYLCQKVVGRPVVMSGNFGENGQPRRLGLLVVTNSAAQVRFAASVRRAIEGCGGAIVDTETIPQGLGCGSAPFAVNENAKGHPVTDFERALSGFKAARISTVIWPGCATNGINGAAAGLDYYPEWVLWGGSALDLSYVGSYGSFFGALDSWSRHAVLVTPSTFRPQIDDRVCFQAMREADPAVPRNDDNTELACLFVYDGLRQVFSNIQLAGPALSPAAMVRGARRFSVRSSNPQVPSCGYPAGDYSCIKDAEVQWWDRLGASEPLSGLAGTDTRFAGCWRAMQGGQRYFAGRWPAGNIDAQMRDGDPCTYQGAYPVP